ncbi:MAG: hypothetical protein P1U32_03265 [Legionellaceae bacterium]|nr:hypothetical protein [Legionellaceae bacterium]
MKLHLATYGTSYPEISQSTGNIRQYYTYTCEAVADDYTPPQSDSLTSHTASIKDFELHKVFIIDINELLENDYITTFLKELSLRHQYTMPEDDDLARMHENIMKKIASPETVASVRHDIYELFTQFSKLPQVSLRPSEQISLRPSVKTAELPVNDFLHKRIGQTLRLLFDIDDMQNSKKIKPFFPSQETQQRKATIQLLQGYGRLFYQLINSESVTQKYVETCQSIIQTSHTILHASVPKSRDLTQFVTTAKMLTERLLEAAERQLHEERIQAKQAEHTQPSCP